MAANAIPFFLYMMSLRNQNRGKSNIMFGIPAPYNYLLWQLCILLVWSKPEFLKCLGWIPFSRVFSPGVYWKQGLFQDVPGVILKSNIFQDACKPWQHTTTYIITQYTVYGLSWNQLDNTQNLPLDRYELKWLIKVILCKFSSYSKIYTILYLNYR